MWRHQVTSVDGTQTWYSLPPFTVTVIFICPSANINRIFLRDLSWLTVRYNIVTHNPNQPPIISNWKINQKCLGPMLFAFCVLSAILNSMMFCPSISKLQRPMLVYQQSIEEVNLWNMTKGLREVLNRKKSVNFHTFDPKKTSPGGFKDAIGSAYIETYFEGGWEKSIGLSVILEHSEIF